MILRIYGKWLVYAKWVIKQFTPIMGYCRKCGRRVHDYSVSDKIWEKVTGIKNGSGIYCYDCFCEISDNKGIYYRDK